MTSSEYAAKLHAAALAIERAGTRLPLEKDRLKERAKASELYNEEARIIRAELVRGR